MRFSPVQRLSVDCEKKSENVAAANDVAGEKLLLSAKNDAKTGNCKTVARKAGLFYPRRIARTSASFGASGAKRTVLFDSALSLSGTAPIYGWNRRSMAEKTGKAS
jgi:hypothetical protein